MFTKQATDAYESIRDRLGDGARLGGRQRFKLRELGFTISSRKHHIRINTYAIGI